jgi:endonuclease/exonuclease/phosphatase family metal-dependent hydrolase
MVARLTGMVQRTQDGMLAHLAGLRERARHAQVDYLATRLAGTLPPAAPSHPPSLPGPDTELQQNKVRRR